MAAQRSRPSHLYSLTSLGVGTAGVESLTGYVARLAEAHAVEAGTLINRELLPQVPCTKGALAGQTPFKVPHSFYFETHSVNGTGERATLWAALLERFTCVDRLDLLTALPWAKVISCVHLVRTRRAWCSSCYGVERDAGPEVYERLLWAFQVVTVCPDHHCPLETVCRFCQQDQHVLSPKSRPGYCSRCRSWLGREPERPGQGGSEASRVAEMVGELIAASPGLPPGFGLDQFQENARHLGGKGRFSGDFRHRNVRGWMRRGNAPRMDSLSVLSQSQNISMLALLTERIKIENVTIGQRHASPHAHYRVADAVAEGALRTALQEEPPRSLEDVARAVGYRGAASLQNRFPGLCRQVVTRRRSWLQSCGPVDPPLPRDRIEQALSEALNQDGPVSLHALAAKIGLRNRRRLYKGFHDLRRAVVAKNKRLRQQSADATVSALRAASNETPVPTITELARRLGLRDVNRITRRFPELADALRPRRQQSSNMLLCTQSTQHGN